MSRIPLPKIDIDGKHKCEACVEANLPKTSFHPIEQSSEPLGWVYTDV